MIYKSIIGAMCACLAVVSFNVSAATLYLPDSGWQEISWVDPSGGNNDVNAEGAFSFTVTENQSPILTVTDSGWNGERIEVFNYGVYTGFWSSSPSSPSGTVWTSSYDVAASSSQWSTGVWDLAAGDYELTFRLQRWWLNGDDIPPNTWVAAFKVDVNAVPVHASVFLFCSGIFGLIGFVRLKNKQ